MSHPIRLAEEEPQARAEDPQDSPAVCGSEIPGQSKLVLFQLAVHSAPNCPDVDILEYTEVQIGSQLQESQMLAPPTPGTGLAWLDDLHTVAKLGNYQTHSQIELDLDASAYCPAA